MKRTSKRVSYQCYIAVGVVPVGKWITVYYFIILHDVHELTNWSF